jgi:putative IMPACT (imprinted ancient) family translation regulator
MSLRRVFTLSLSYADLPRVTSVLAEHGAAAPDVSYAESVTITGTIDERETDALFRAVTDATAGRAAPEWGESLFAPVPIGE